MSIRAMNWAMEQATGCPWTQCLLYVVADCANPEGICWPSADWMAEKSQQSRATVYRRLNEMREMGLLVLFPRFIDDDGKIHYEGATGRRQTSPEIRLIFSAKVDLPRKRTRRNPEEIDDEDTGGVSLSATGVSQCSDSPPVAAERHPPSHCSDSSMNRNLEPKKESPLPPKGGDTQHSNEFEGKQWPHTETWAAFEAAYSEPIVRQSTARQVWSALTDDERILATRAAKGYVAHRRAQKKQTTSLNAHTFLKERDAWAGLAARAPPEEKPPKQESRFVSAESSEFRARQVLDVLLGYEPRQGRAIPEKGNGYMASGPELGPEFIALAQFDPFDQRDWFELWHDKPEHKHQLGAWRERVGELSWKSVETGEVIKVLGKEYPRRERFSLVPCEWPPRKDGTLSSTGPPVAA